METLSLAESAARQIADMIHGGVLSPGDRLPSERALSATLGLSRSALREGLRTLEAVGLVHARVGSGRHVSVSGSLDPNGGLTTWMQLQSVGDVIAVRRILEPAAIMAIPTTRLREIADSCAQVFAQMTSSFTLGSFEAATRFHTQFHQTLARCAPSRLHDVLLNGMITAGEAAQLDIFRVQRAGRHSLSIHAWILEAIQHGDVDEAARRVAEHLVPEFTYPEAGDFPV